MIELILSLIAIIIALTLLLIWALNQPCKWEMKPKNSNKMDYVSEMNKKRKDINYLDIQFNDSMPTVIMRDMQNV